MPTQKYTISSLDLIKGFEAVARTSSFTRAAAELFLTQSAVSRQIRNLEDQLGVSLFERRPRSLKLTPEGELLYDTAKKILAELEEAARRLRYLNGRQVVTLSTTTSFASLWLIPRISGFIADNPGIDVRISTSNALADIDREGIDLAVRTTRREAAPPGTLPLFDDVVFPVCSPRLASGDKASATAAELENFVLVSYTGPTSSAWGWDAWMKSVGLRGLRPAGEIQFSQYEQAVQAMIAGQGIGLGRSVLIGDTLAANKLIAPFGMTSFARIRYFIVTPQTRRSRPAVDALIEWLRREGRNACRVPPAHDGHDREFPRGTAVGDNMVLHASAET